MHILYTIGHSNRKFPDFLSLLKQYKINRVIDVRTIPKSRFVPWTNEKQLEKNLEKENIEYMHFPQLGGLRTPCANSVNLGWRNKSFRGYADYMQTDDFFIALKELNRLLKKDRVAIMCAEAVPWRCHRSLIADAELSRGIKVIHIISDKSSQEHVLTSFAVVDDKSTPIRVIYPLENKKNPQQGDLL
ncbi:Uncharacterized conserved protein (plasmid) [Legionella adelaidensis]|uniref:Uncharacterized conserved protein n=1 Tax=Legionella adelaidensis TaxID=45056 RepID=A0A0W0R1M1_9GAMM|nr:DUF488 domain-containing protein [Legionella adelaidensis]KTC64993.1 hypothetical protein Lade_1673 [Legionella adelaidensis]VEH85327.1 Uncharacterized conserved protein [Legionella adelaidensis]